MTECNPLVSVVIPAYNRGSRISRTLESVINQDYDNIEIIVVNDCSTDDTVKIAEKVLSTSSRKYSIVNHEINRGKSEARNTGIDASHGKYIWFCDSDDFADENFVSVEVAKIEYDNSDMVFCGRKRWYENENKYTHIEIYPDRVLSRDEYFRLWSIGEIRGWSMWNCLFRKSFILQNKIRYRKCLLLAQDTEFVMKALALSQNISFASGASYIYVQHDENIAANHNRSKPEFYKYELSAIMYFGRFIIRHIQEQQVTRYVMDIMIGSIIRMCELCACAGDQKFYYHELRRFRHKKVRKFILSSVKSIFRDPKLFKDSVLLLYCPQYYYEQVRRRSKVDTVQKKAKFYAQNNERENYDMLVQKFRHRKMRKLMLSSVKSIWHKPEQFFKSVLLVYFPNFYYKARSRKS